MTMIVDLKNNPKLKMLIQRVDPKYRKQKAIVVVTKSVTMSDTYWDGGSRSSYSFVSISTGHSKPMPQYAPPQFGGPRVAPTVELVEGIMGVSTGTFCGKTKTATVYLNEVDAQTFFPGYDFNRD